MSFIFFVITVILSIACTNENRDFIIESNSIGFEYDDTIFADPNLENVVRNNLGRPRGSINVIQLETITRLDANSSGIISLDGVEKLSGLRELYLSNNELTDLSSLRGLEKLRILDLSSNKIRDLSPLAKLSNLTHLNIDDNQVENIDPLKSSYALEVLTLDYNNVTNVDRLLNLPALESVELSGNELTTQTINLLRDRGVQVAFYERAITFEDARLEDAVRRVIGKPTGDLTPSDLHSIIKLNVPGRTASLVGLEQLENLFLEK